jgi:pimeloyl-ACP methyl ester carboxylesterase
MTSLVLLPGLLNDERLWQHQVTALENVAHCQVANISREDSMAALAASVLKQAPAGKFALAGLSMGGYVALEVIRQAPERVTGLALLDTSARPDTSESTENRRRLMQLAEKDFTAVVAALLPKMVNASHLSSGPIAGLFKAMANDVGKEAFLRQQRAIIGRIDSRPHLKQIQCPTLILCGRDDAITPVAIHEEMAAAIPHVELALVDNSGHLSPIEQPGAVSEAMKKWLRSLV